MLTRLNPELLITIFERFLEAGEVDRRERAIKIPARKLEAAMAKAFAKQGASFLKAMDKYKGQFAEAVSPNTMANAVRPGHTATWSEMTKAMQEAIGEGLEAGGDGLMNALDIPSDDLLGFGFDVMNQEAIKYAKDHAAAQVTKINTTTMERMRSLIGQATEEGWSYGRLAGQIKNRFEGMSSTRAKRIASHELRDAYETGQRVMIDRLGKHGLPMETKWLTAGDNRVRDSHRDSSAEGWKDVGFVFSSGGEHPPTDPGCRCTSLYRRKK